MADDTNNILGVNPEPQPQSPVHQIDLRLTRARKLSHRYSDGYKMANILVSLGGVVKVLGFIVGGIALLVGLIGAAAAGERSGIGGLGIFFIAILYGAGIAFFLFVQGTVVAGIGELIRSVCDGAVFNAPFLDDEDRASILALDE
jgi:hypothetical protein